MTTITLNAVRVARTLRNTEHSIDEALVQGADYLKSMIEGRRQFNLAAEVGQDALDAAVESLSLMVQARSAQVRSHSAVARVAEAQNVGWRLDGPLEQKLEPTAVPKIA